MTGDETPARPRAEVIYRRVMEDARDELGRSSAALGFSGLFAGFTIGATPLVTAASLALLDGDDAKFVAALLYPLGFVAAILGRAQLFTENTLYPVVASFDDRRCLPGTARLWAVVLATNTVGGVLFALLAIESGGLPADATLALSARGDEAAAREFTDTFWSAVLAGWLLALVAWVVEAAETAVGQLFAIWLIVIPIGLVPLDHSVATAVEVAGAMFHGDVGVGEWLGWLGTTVLGNVAGGVVIVSLLNYGQIAGES